MPKKCLKNASVFLCVIIFKGGKIFMKNKQYRIILKNKNMEEKLENLAKENNESISTTIRKILIYFFEKHENETEELNLNFNETKTEYSNFDLKDELQNLKNATLELAKYIFLNKNILIALFNMLKQLGLLQELNFSNNSNLFNEPKEIIELIEKLFSED